MSKNLQLYRKEYIEYTELLSAGNVYYILISKRLLFSPMILIWVCIFALFLIRSEIFFAMIGLPSIIVYACFLFKIFPLWKSCNFSLKAYIAFHSVCVLILKIISMPVSLLLEVIWTLCF